MPPRARVARPVKAKPGSTAHTDGLSGGERLGAVPSSVTAGKRKRLTLQLEGKMAMLAAGDITVQDMDNEELARLQFKDKNGGFTGRRPANLPQVLVNLMRKELIERVSAVRQAALEDANKLLVDVIANSSSKDADRIKAALALIERVEGKVPDKVELSTGDKPFEVHMAKSVRIVRGGGGEGDEE